MKKLTLLLVSIVISFCSLISQTTPPQAFKYQAVVRDNLGAIVANQEVNFRFSIRDEIPVGPILYQETQLEFTDAYGRANLEIGRGDETIGVFEDIDWGDDERYLEVELDLEGGATFVSMGTTQLLAVPYALYAESTGDTSRWKKADNDLYYNNGNIGVGTNTPQYNLDIYGNVTGQSRLRLTNPDNSKILLFGSGNDSYNSSITFHDGDALRFMRYDGGYSELMRIRSDGNVGIGTPIPAEKLSILGNIELRVEGYDPYIRLNSDDAGDGTTEYIWSEDSKGLAFGDMHGSPQVLIEYVTGNVGIGTDIPEESAKLEVNSNSQGFLLPRMSTSEIGGISNPADGLQAYNTDDGKLYIFVATLGAWKEISYGTSTIPVLADYIIGIGGSCDNTVVSGIYLQDLPVSPNHYITLEINVLSTGDYAIYTDTLNGYFFIGTGTFVSSGIQTTQLFADGIPIGAQTDNFIATASNDGGLCTFNIDVQESNCGEIITDIDGNTYNTVQIGSQCWMAENLNTGEMINSSLNPTNDGQIQKFCYNNTEGYCDDLGGLYEWHEMMEYVTTQGSQGICPTGWHIPTDEEWKMLEGYVDLHYGYPDPEWDAGGWRGFNAGDRLKSISDFGSDLFGFTALLAGKRFGPNFNYLDQDAYFWSSTQNGPTQSVSRQLQNSSDQIARPYDDWLDGFSVRCLKD